MDLIIEPYTFLKRDNLSTTKLRKGDKGFILYLTEKVLHRATCYSFFT